MVSLIELVSSPFQLVMRSALSVNHCHRPKNFPTRAAVGPAVAQTSVLLVAPALRPQEKRRDGREWRLACWTSFWLPAGRAGVRSMERGVAHSSCRTGTADGADLPQIESHSRRRKAGTGDRARLLMPVLTRACGLRGGLDRDGRSIVGAGCGGPPRR
jgi:hypothetical protein